VKDFSEYHQTSMFSSDVDLSKLRIQREEETVGASQPRPPRSKFMLIGIVAMIIIIGIILISIFGFESPEIVEVTNVSLVSPSQASALLTASGYVVAQRKAAVASKATGRLVYLGFEEGDRVKQGQVIARIESADIEAQLAQAKANLEQAKAEKNDAEQTWNRAKQLFERNLISKAELDAAQARYDRVVAAIAAAEAAVQNAEVQLEYTYIRAPFDGTILTKNADVGEVVAPFAAGASSRVAIVTLADMNSLEVEADVSESNIERVYNNQPCEIVLDAYPDVRYRGYVSKIVPTADRAKATVLTKIKFTQFDSRVLPEMSAKVHFLSSDTKNTEPQTQSKLSVDSRAVVTRNGKTVAFRVSENIVTEVPVTLGETMGSLVEIKSGLTAGDTVILRPSEKLSTGTKVKLKE
jgi:RND family efflux transporter MFP subunit